MFKTTGLLALVAVGFFGYPLIAEDVKDPCTATERRILKLIELKKSEDPTGHAMAMQFFSGLSQGSILRSAIVAKYPDLPPLLACSYLYYRVWLEPEPTLREITTRMRRQSRLPNQSRFLTSRA